MNGLKKILAGAAFAGAVLGVGARAYSSPDFSLGVSTTTEIANYDPDSPGNELKITYKITNNSPFDLDDGVRQFSINAGSNRGIYQAVGPTSEFNASLGLDNVVFNSAGSFYNIKPGQSGEFSIYAHAPYLGTTSGTWNSTSKDNTSLTGSTVVPESIPEPSTAAALALLGAGVIVTGKRR